VEGPLREANDRLAEQRRLNQDLARSVGLSRYELERMNAATQMYNEYARLGVPITEDLKNNIDQYAQNAAQAAVETENLQKRIQLVEEFHGIGKDALKGFITDLRQGKSAAEALENALNRVADRILDMVLDDIFAPPSGRGSTGILGMFGSLFGAGGAQMHTGGMVGIDGQLRFVHPSYFEGAPRLHRGTMARLAPDERTAILQTGELVLSRDDVAAARKGGGGGTVVQPVVNIIGAPSTPEVRQNEDGSVDVVFEQFESWQADRASRGRGPLVKAVGARNGGRALIG